MAAPGPDLFDSHLHLTDDRFSKDVDDVVARAREAGVRHMVTVASDLKDATAAHDLAERLGIHATAGIHPHAASTWAPDMLDSIRALLAEPRVVAVGETGLDFHYDNSPRDAQRESFEAHLDLAAELDLPLVVHCREADAEMARIVRSRGTQVRGVLHCFSGSEELFEAGMAADWFFSFGGMVTFKSFAHVDCVQRVPWNRLMLETDSPYLAPVPRRGRRNEPAFVNHTCDAVAILRGSRRGEVAERTTAAALDFYRLDPA